MPHLVRFYFRHPAPAKGGSAFEYYPHSVDVDQDASLVTSKKIKKDKHKPRFNVNEIGKIDKCIFHTRSYIIRPVVKFQTMHKNQTQAQQIDKKIDKRSDDAKMPVPRPPSDNSPIALHVVNSWLLAGGMSKECWSNVVFSIIG